MFDISVRFQVTYLETQLNEIKEAYLSGVKWPDIVTSFDVGLAEETMLLWAQELGWDLETQIESYMEQLVTYFDLDGEMTESINRLLVNEALEYIEAHVKVSPVESAS